MREVNGAPRIFRDGISEPSDGLSIDVPLSFGLESASSLFKKTVP